MSSSAVLCLLSILLKMALSFNDIRDAPIKSANESKHRKQHISVFDMEFKHRCLQSDVKANKEVFKDLPAYALLSNDQKASLSSDFTICSSASKESGTGLTFFSILGDEGDLVLQAHLFNIEKNATLFLTFEGGKAYSPNASLPLVFPHQWVHSCLAISSESSHVLWVIDGHVVENTTLRVLLNGNMQTNLTGRLL